MLAVFERGRNVGFTYCIALSSYGLARTKAAFHFGTAVVSFPPSQNCAMQLSKFARAATTFKMKARDKLTAVGFEPTPLRNGALSHRLRPLGQTVLPRRAAVAPLRFERYERSLTLRRNETARAIATLERSPRIGRATFPLFPCATEI